MTEELRAGQKAFNDLYETNPELADYIRDTHLDPFYDDSRLPYFKAAVLFFGSEDFEKLVEALK